MFVDLIDRLRCPTPHADTWLVAAASRIAHRRLIDATLGCPECGAEYAVRDGEVWFGARVERAAMTVSEDEAMRAAALLKLQEHGLYVLDGAWSSLTTALQNVLDVDLLLIDPPATVLDEGATAQGILRGVGSRWPLADGAVHGVALDDDSVERVADAVRVLSAGGRLVAPVSAVVPAGARELARDDRHWVAEKIGDVVPLARARK